MTAHFRSQRDAARASALIGWLIACAFAILYVAQLYAANASAAQAESAWDMLARCNAAIERAERGGPFRME